MFSLPFLRFFSGSGAKVAVVGASGGIGQPLSLLLKLNPLVRELALYDLNRPPGVAVDLSHINSPCEVYGLRGVANLPEILTGSDVVVIPAGVPRKPGMTRDDLFVMNAKVGLQLADYCSRYCPEAKVLLITNPINSILPLFNEVYNRRGIDAGNRLFGITLLDSIRASTFIAAALHVSPHLIRIPVVGGHAGTTIIPLLSQLPLGMLRLLDIPDITTRIQFAGDEVVSAKEGTGSATLAMAYAASEFTTAVLRAMNGEENVIEPAFVRQDFGNCRYFSSLVRLGKNGMEEALPLPSNMSFFEREAIEKAMPVLKKQAQKGIDFVTQEMVLRV